MGWFNTQILKDIRDLLQTSVAAQAEQLHELRTIRAQSRDIRLLLYRLARPQRPGSLKVRITGEQHGGHDHV